MANMEKIQALLEKAGCNPNLTNEICKSLDSYKDTLRESFETEYAEKVKQAKAVCVEEVEAHKRELARRVQIFCETKGHAIETTLAKQSALNESEAFAKLPNIKSMLAGVEPNGTPNGDVTAMVKKAKQQVKVANEAREKAESIANRQSAIAERAMKKNRQLATQLQKVVSEGKGPRQRRTVNEGAGQQQQSRRIDKGRSNGKARSSRPTLVENQDRRPRGRNQQPQGKGFGINNIAESMDTDL